MTLTYSYPALTPGPSFGLSKLKAIFIEPVLVVGVSAFWLLMLPFVGLSLLCVRIGDTIAASLANPLILRRGDAAKGVPALQHGGAATTARV
jgi:hypothetical protein